jgi:hypothetical protein
MAAKKQKSSVQFILDYLEMQQVYAEMSGVKIVSDTLQNILDKITASATKLHQLEIDQATMLGRQQVLDELHNELTIDKLV